MHKIFVYVYDFQFLWMKIEAQKPRLARQELQEDKWSLFNELANIIDLAKASGL